MARAKSLPKCRDCTQTLVRSVTYCPYCGGLQNITPVSTPDLTAVPKPENPRDEQAAAVPEQPSTPDTRGTAEPPTIPERDSQLDVPPMPKVPKKAPQQRHALMALMGLIAVAFVIGVIVRAGHSDGNDGKIPAISQGSGQSAEKPAAAPPSQPIPQDPAPESKAGQPSIACADTHNADETTICQNSGLAALAKGVTDLYESVRIRNGGTVPQEIQDTMSAGLQSRRECGADVDCINNVLLAQKSYLSAQLP